MVASSAKELKEATAQPTRRTTPPPLRVLHRLLASHGMSTHSNKMTRTSDVYDFTRPEYVIAVSHTVNAAASRSEIDTA